VCVCVCVSRQGHCARQTKTHLPLRMSDYLSPRGRKSQFHTFPPPPSADTHLKCLTHICAQTRLFMKDHKVHDSAGFSKSVIITTTPVDHFFIYLFFALYSTVAFIVKHRDISSLEGFLWHRLFQWMMNMGRFSSLGTVCVYHTMSLAINSAVSYKHSSFCLFHKTSIVDLACC